MDSRSRSRSRRKACLSSKSLSSPKKRKMYWDSSDEDESITFPNIVSKTTTTVTVTRTRTTTRQASRKAQLKSKENDRNNSKNNSKKSLPRNSKKNSKESNSKSSTSGSSKNGTSANRSSKEKLNISTKQSIIIESSSQEFAKTLLTYPPNSGRLAVVSLIASDIYTLNPDRFLNDQLIDFWLLYMYNETLNEKDRARTHVFSSYFFNSLRMGNSLKKGHHQGSMLKNWTKNVNIFKKDFIFIPISHRSHWLLAVICFPYLNLMDQDWNSESTDHLESDSSDTPPKLTPEIDLPNNGDYGQGQGNDLGDENVIKKPCILIFDSMAKYVKDHDRIMIYRTLWQFLTAESDRQSKNESILSFTAANTPACTPVVPQQTNKTDCGLFVFKYFERFFSAPLESFEFPIPPMKTWFDRKEVRNSREAVYRKILNMTVIHFPDNFNEVPSLDYCKKMISDEDDTEEGDSDTAAADTEVDTKGSGSQSASTPDPELPGSGTPEDEDSMEISS